MVVEAAATNWASTAPRVNSAPPRKKETPDTALHRPSRMAWRDGRGSGSRTPSRTTSMKPRLRAWRDSQVAVEPSGVLPLHPADERARDRRWTGAARPGPAPRRPSRSARVDTRIGQSVTAIAPTPAGSRLLARVAISADGSAPGGDSRDVRATPTQSSGQIAHRPGNGESRRRLAPAKLPRRQALSVAGAVLRQLGQPPAAPAKRSTAAAASSTGSDRRPAPVQHDPRRWPPAATSASSASAADQPLQAGGIARPDGEHHVGLGQQGEGGTVAPRRHGVEGDLLVGLEANAQSTTVSGAISPGDVEHTRNRRRPHLRPSVGPGDPGQQPEVVAERPAQRRHRRPGRAGRWPPTGTPRPAPAIRRADRTRDASHAAVDVRVDQQGRRSRRGPTPRPGTVATVVRPGAPVGTPDRHHHALVAVRRLPADR